MTERLIQTQGIDSEKIIRIVRNNKKSPQQEDGVFSEIKRFLGLQHLHVEVFKPAIGMFHHQPNHSKRRGITEISCKPSEKFLAYKLQQGAQEVSDKPNCSNKELSAVLEDFDGYIAAVLDNEELRKGLGLLIRKSPSGKSYIPANEKGIVYEVSFARAGLKQDYLYCEGVA